MTVIEHIDAVTTEVLRNEKGGTTGQREKPERRNSGADGKALRLSPIRGAMTFGESQHEVEIALAKEIERERQNVEWFKTPIRAKSTYRPDPFREAAKRA